MSKPLKFAVAAAVVLVLGLSAQATVAAWRAEGEVNAGLLKTGTLSLKVGNGLTAHTDYVFQELQTQTLLPGTFIQAPLTISNAGTAPLAYGLAGIATGTESSQAKDKALAAAATVSIYAGIPAANCQGTQALNGQLLYSGALNSNATFSSPRELASTGSATSSDVLCVRLGLPAGATQNAAGGSMAVTLSFTGQQK